MLAGDDGANINGPSLIRVPDWVARPLGRYYLYFGHHGGRYIRLAYADDLRGPWRIHAPGARHLDQTPCGRHIASPDVHVDDRNRSIRMYYHGVVVDDDGKPLDQCTFLATSADGLQFTSDTAVLGKSYFRVFRWNDTWYALANGALLHRSADPATPFEAGPKYFKSPVQGGRPRHAAVQRVGDALRVFFSRIGDAPEHIMVANLRPTDDWTAWIESPPQTLLLPEMPYEGADLPNAPSVSSAAPGRVRQLRDPALYQEQGRTYLLYSIAGESGIAAAELVP
jgi:hypothetical protein